MQLLVENMNKWTKEIISFSEKDTNNLEAS